MSGITAEGEEEEDDDDDDGNGGAGVLVRKRRKDELKTRRMRTRMEGVNVVMKNSSLFPNLYNIYSNMTVAVV